MAFVGTLEFVLPSIVFALMATKLVIFQCSSGVATIARDKNLNATTHRLANALLTVLVKPHLYSPPAAGDLTINLYDK